MHTYLLINYSVVLILSDQTCHVVLLRQILNL